MDGGGGCTPSHDGGGGYPVLGWGTLCPGMGHPPPARTTEGVLAAWRAVCLLRLRRRTFLFLATFTQNPFDTKRSFVSKRANGSNVLITKHRSLLVRMNYRSQITIAKCSKENKKSFKANCEENYR